MAEGAPGWAHHCRIGAEDAPVEDFRPAAAGRPRGAAPGPPVPFPHAPACQGVPEIRQVPAPLSSPVLSHASRLRGLRPDWLSDPKVWRTEVLAGLVVALALIPEAISFSIIAGVDPAVGLFASFTMAVTISVVGGRRAMISAATGAVALVIAP